MNKKIMNLDMEITEDLKIEESYKLDLKESINNLPRFTGSGDFSNQRAAIQSLAKDIQLYGGNNKDQILKNFAIEVSKNANFE